MYIISVCSENLNLYAYIKENALQNCKFQKEKENENLVFKS